MARVTACLFGVFVTAVALIVPAQRAVAAPTPPQDFVAGSGEAGLFEDISFAASSDPLGGSANGVVSFVIEIPIRPPFVAPVFFSGPVTCLAVDGNRAVIGFTSFIGPMKVVVADSGSTGSPGDDVFGVTVRATDCSNESGVGVFPLSFGDIVVRDAPSKAQCKDGGWRNYTDAAGRPFSDQGQCIAFALGAA